MITAEIDVSRAQDSMDALYAAMLGAGQDASNLVKDETRRLAKTIVSFTPPIKGTAGTPRSQGEHAIEREFNSLFSEATPRLIDEVGSKYGLHNIRTAYLTEQGGQRLNLQWDHLDPTGDRMDQYHKMYQRDGKVPLVRRQSKTVWASRVVVPLGSRGPFIKKFQAHVGRWKATFALVGSRLGDTFPAWISRHFGSLGETGIADLSGLSDAEKPSITFGSRSPGNNKIRSSIQAALNTRARAMVSRARLIVSGYAKDVAQGMRPRAGQTRGGSEERIE